MSAPHGRATLVWFLGSVSSFSEKTSFRFFVLGVVSGGVLVRFFSGEGRDRLLIRFGVSPGFRFVVRVSLGSGSSQRCRYVLLVSLKFGFVGCEW